MLEDYVRKARLVRVVDGDTLVVDIDLGFGTWNHKQKVRLLGVNCPENKGATKDDGLRASLFTRDWFQGNDLMIQTVLVADGKDAFGRVLAKVKQGERCLNDDLLSSGHAVVFKE